MSMTDRDQAAQERWRKTCDAVTLAMKIYTKPFISPLSREREDSVRHVGTGSFINWAGRTLLLTCEHVDAEGPLNFSFHGSDNVFAITDRFKSDRDLDAAFVSVGDAQWNACLHQAMRIPSVCVAGQHKPTRDEELHFFHGFAGENSHYGFNVLDSAASAYLTQQSSVAIKDDQIFELLWDPQRTNFVESTSIEAQKSVSYTDPGGFSGSLVWNTRYLEVTSTGHSWTPECAVVTGLLKRWDTATKTLLVTRVEHLRRYLEAEV